MEFSGNVSRSDMRDLVEGLIGSAVWSKLSTYDCDLQIKVDRNLVPEIILSVPDDLYMHVRFTTVELVEGDEVVGYGFDTVINNAGINEKDPEVAISRFKKWSGIASLALEISKTEVYPGEYFE